MSRLFSILTALALTASAPLLTACDTPAEVQTERSVTIDANDLSTLDDNESYVIEPLEEVVYHLDPSAGAIDLSRVSLPTADGSLESLQQVLLADPELDGIPLEALAHARMTIRAADAVEDEITTRAAGCVGVVIVTSEVVVVVVVCQAQ